MLIKQVYEEHKLDKNTSLNAKNIMEDERKINLAYKQKVIELMKKNISKKGDKNNG